MVGRSSSGSLPCAAIGFAGDGWGAIAALASLQRHFKRVEVRSGDPAVLALLRPADHSFETLDAIRAETIVCAGYQPIVPEELLMARTFVNVHYSLLPRYRGMHSTVWAILNGEPILGLTVHVMNRDIDDGPVLAQFELPYEGQTSAQVMESCNAIVTRELGSVVARFVDGDLEPVPQDRSKATWVPRRNREDCHLDFSWTCEQVERFFRALVRPYPLPILISRGGEYEITRASIIHRPYYCTTGRVVNLDADGAWIKLSDGLLLVQELEQEGQLLDPRTVLTRGQRL
jgi:methionyl-tRNA formyltransferase